MGSKPSCVFENQVHLVESRDDLFISIHCKGWGEESSVISFLAFDPLYRQNCIFKKLTRINAPNSKHFVSDREIEKRAKKKT